MILKPPAQGTKGSLAVDSLVLILSEQRDHLKPVDIHQSQVSDLESRNHLEGKKGKRHEGVSENASQRPVGLFETTVCLCHFFQGSRA